MNPVEEQLPPPQHPHPHRISTSCDRHPDEHFTGFCPSCLFERLSLLDQSAASASSTSAFTADRKSASSALKSIFRGSGEKPSFRTRPGSFLPELRRTKSFSGDGAGFGFTRVFEPQRKSCDVRARNTLYSFFNQDNANRTLASTSSKGAAFDPIQGKFKNSRSIVLELHEEDEREQEVFYEEGEEEQVLQGEEQCGEIPESCEIEEIEEPISNYTNPKLSTEEQLGDILEAEFKPMKDHMDLDSRSKKAGGKDLKELADSFWSAASVFSKKLKSWRKNNNKLKKHSGGRTVQVNKKSNAGRSCRETQSEIADYGNGRRSCNIDPRFSLDAGRMSLDYSRISLDAGRMSLDAGRMSLDDPRYSFDEPRASWDGYLIGGGRPATNFPRMPSMLSVVEGSPAQSSVNPPHQPSVTRKDRQIPLEEPRKSINDEEFVPGGAAQTKDYYSDSSSRRRKSIDRSNSIRKTAASVVAELDDVKQPGISNTKVTPAAVEYLHGGSGKGFVGIDRESRDSIPNSLNHDRSESFDFGFRDSGSVVGGSGERKESKKSKSWKSWNIWGLIVRQGSNRDEDDDRCSRANGVGRSFSESWLELGRDGYGGNPRIAYSRNSFRSNSSVSWRNSYSNGGSIGGGSLRKNSVELNGHAKKRSNEFVLERNWSARFSPKDADNGLLRFYLAPLKGSRREANAKAKPPAYSHTIARTMLRMY